MTRRDINSVGRVWTCVPNVRRGVHEPQSGSWETDAMTDVAADGGRSYGRGGSMGRTVVFVRESTRHANLTR